jgi:ketosteroid isomerase-like protein
MAADEAVKQEILKANKHFYDALARADLAAMEALWHHDQAIECIHPGWDRLRGWPAVQDSWARMFDHQGAMQIQASDQLVHWRGDIAWVTCYENLTIQDGPHVHVSQMMATNVFERFNGQWKMVIHHASPAPNEPIKPRNRKIFLN